MRARILAGLADDDDGALMTIRVLHQLVRHRQAENVANIFWTYRYSQVEKLDSALAACQGPEQLLASLRRAAGIPAR
jgi:hypothetical protein